PRQRQRLLTLLRQQRERVLAYAGARAPHLLITGQCERVVATSGALIQAAERYPDIRLHIPEGWSPLLVEYGALPVASHHEEIALAFLAFLRRPDILIQEVQNNGCFPCYPLPYEHIDAESLLARTYRRVQEWEGEQCLAFCPLEEKEVLPLWIQFRG
ncbi:MAG: hypothetical protein VXZ72_03360, partial [Chlamydiota bacterium]|nr:hypothetical protein [Chlamydiota bacterium]